MDYLQMTAPMWAWTTRRSGVGFFFLQTSGLAFVGCMSVNLGLGLLAAAILSRPGSTDKQ